MNNVYSAQTSIEIEATPEQVWETLVNPDIVKLYLHGTTLNADWREGGDITWSGEWNGQSYVDKGKVLAYMPFEIIKTTHWSPLSGKEDKAENYHHVTYELKADKGKTIFTLIHGNSQSQQDADSMIESGWKPMLQEIKRLAELHN